MSNRNQITLRVEGITCDGCDRHATEALTSRTGEIVVYEHLQTANPDIYAAGDCTGDPMYVYVAAYAGGLAAENALRDAGRIYDLFALPRVTFTDPQIASSANLQARADVEFIAIRIAHAKISQPPLELLWRRLCRISPSCARVF
jgi:mercuric reductase